MQVALARTDLSGPGSTGSPRTRVHRTGQRLPTARTVQWAATRRRSPRPAGRIAVLPPMVALSPEGRFLVGVPLPERTSIGRHDSEAAASPGPDAALTSTHDPVMVLNRRLDAAPIGKHASEAVVIRRSTVIPTGSRGSEDAGAPRRTAVRTAGAPGPRGRRRTLDPEGATADQRTADLVNALPFGG